MAKVLQTSRNLMLQCQPFLATALRTSITIPYDHTAVSPQALATAKPFNQVPGYRNVPFIGTAWVFFPVVGKFNLRKAHLYDRAKYEKFGPISLDKLGEEKLVSLYDPHDVETVFRNESKYPSRGGFASLATYRKMRKHWFPSLGIALLDGKEWRDLRFKLQRNMMQPRVVENYVKPMEEVARELITSIKRNKDKKNEVPEFLRELNKWAFESVAFVGLDTRLGCLNERPNEEATELIKSIQTTFDCVNHLEGVLGNVQLWKWFSTPTWRKFVRVMDYFTETTFKYVNITVSNVKAKGLSLKEEDLTLAQLMLGTEGLKTEDVVTMILDMLFAGVDTTSYTVAFFLYDLAKNPEKQDKMYREIIDLLPNPTDRITPEFLKRINYTKYCFRESQRLNPIARGVARRLDKDMVLAGYKIPKGTLAVGMLQVIGRQEKYFKNANKFIPERWMDEKNKSHPFAFMPFGFGIRSCIGRRLAELEVLCASVEIIRNFKVEYHHQDLDIITSLVTTPDGPLQFRFLNRTPQENKTQKSYF